MDEEALIAAVLRVRVSAPESSAAQVKEALAAEGHGDLTLSQVKKACSKASKRNPRVAGADAPAQQEQVPTKSRREEKAEKAAEEALKSAERAMIVAQRRAHNAGGAPPPMQSDDFIKWATGRALTGMFDARMNEVANEQRLEADIATIEWIRLATGAGVLEVTETQLEEAMAYLEKLRKVRASRALDEAIKEFYSTQQAQLKQVEAAEKSAVVASADPALERASLDRAILAANQPSGEAIDDVD